MTQQHEELEWLDEILRDYRYEVLHNDDGKRGEDFDIDQAKQSIAQKVREEILRARRNEVGLIDMGDPEYPRKRLEELKND